MTTMWYFIPQQIQALFANISCFMLFVLQNEVPHAITPYSCIMQVPRHVKIHISVADSEVILPTLANAAQILVLQAQQIQMQEGLFGSAGTHSPSSAKIYS